MNYDQLASEQTVQRTIEALKRRGVEAEFLQTGGDALERLRELIPYGREVMTASSTTLKEIGFVEMLKHNRYKWVNVKEAILAEKDEAKQAELRRKTTTSEYFIGSVHAVAETGEILVASATGSQIPSYTYSSDNIIWVVGTQKIVPTVEDGFKRIREYCLPLEDKRMRAEGYLGSIIGKILLFEQEISPSRKLKLIFVNEKLGF